MSTPALLRSSFGHLLKRFSDSFRQIASSISGLEKTGDIFRSIFQGDFNKHVFLDVTPLMQEAQRLGLQNFQIRILEDLGTVSPGQIEINDTTGANRSILAPLLEVTYY